MQASTRADLVDEIVNSILEKLRDCFPIRKHLDVEGIAADCGVPLEIKNVDGQQVRNGDEVFGESFVDLVQACGWWLSAEGYLLSIDSGAWPYYTLSERGARLAQCLPPTLHSD